jgi:hypothetical protein
MARDWKTLQEAYTIKAHVLASQRSLEMALDLTPPPSTQLHRAQTFAHVGEYEQCMHWPPTFLRPHQLKPL